MAAKTKKKVNKFDELLGLTGPMMPAEEPKAKVKPKPKSKKK